MEILTQEIPTHEHVHLAERVIDAAASDLHDLVLRQMLDLGTENGERVSVEHVKHVIATLSTTLCRLVGRPGQLAEVAEPGLHQETREERDRWLLGKSSKFFAKLCAAVNRHYEEGWTLKQYSNIVKSRSLVCIDTTGDGEDLDPEFVKQCIGLAELEDFYRIRMFEIVRRVQQVDAVGEVLLGHSGITEFSDNVLNLLPVAHFQDESVASVDFNAVSYDWDQGRTHVLVERADNLSKLRGNLGVSYSGEWRETTLAAEEQATGRD